MAFIYTLMILFVLYCIISDWFMHEYDESLNGNNFHEFKIGSFFSYQVNVLKSLKRLVNLNEDNLAKQPIFWIGTILPLIVSGWIEYHVILLNPDLLSFEKLDDFFKASSSAIYISALTPTLGILISNIHKSIQTEKQIEQSEIKGKIDSFNAHYKFITDRIIEIKERKLSHEENIEDYNLFFTLNLSVVYRKAFPKSTLKNGYNGDLVSKKYIRNLKIKIENLAKIGVISFDDILILAQKKEEGTRVSDMEKLIITNERLRALNALARDVGLGSHRKNYIDICNSKGHFKSELKIVTEYASIYLKLYYYTFYFLSILEVKNSKEIVEPCLKAYKDMFKAQREYLKLKRKK
ncbi:hypothetical protein [Providencia rettgeri]|uniref:hypothetical protein n=1 Tax=Providencia rettgeri TaxID=587 RepID=UPI002360B2C0|nr:hypothetical protein [Providencia rettgeri]